MSVGFRTPLVRWRPPLLLPPDPALAEERKTPERWARAIPLRPARITFPDGQDGKDPATLEPDRPVARLHTWRGYVLGWTVDEHVPVQIAEVPSGRTISTELRASLFEPVGVPARPGQLFVLRCWYEWIEQRWVAQERVSPP